MHAPKRAEYPLAPLGDAGREIALDPTWDRARKLLADGRRCARALAAEIERLREMYLRDKASNLRKGPTSQLVTSGKDTGFQAQLRAQLDLHPQQAARLVLDAQRERQIYAIASGDLEVVEDESGPRPVTEQVRAAAAQAVRAIEADLGVRPARAWAGLWGRAATADRGRAAVDHSRNIRRGLVALATSLEHWAELAPEERAVHERAWGEILEAGILPDTWLQAVGRILGQSRPRPPAR